VDHFAASVGARIFKDGENLSKEISMQMEKRMNVLLCSDSGISILSLRQET